MCGRPIHESKVYCPLCTQQIEAAERSVSTAKKTIVEGSTSVPQTLAQKYPKYYKAIPEGMTEIDVYGVHMLFDIQDPSGAIQHASKKLLLSGVRTGNKTKYQDIMEARDTLTRWLALSTEK